jgi:hemoglobin/transferrin/lactoferrin receptor protein
VADPETGGRISLDDNWSDLVGSARLVYQFVPDTLNAYAGVSQGFRAPNLSDLTRFDIARTSEIETPQPDLDAERYVSYEAGVKTQGEWWAATAAYYYTVIDDAIIRAPTGAMIDGRTEVTKRNGGDGFTHGVELGVAVRPHEDWTLFGNMTWMDGELDQYPTSAPVKVTEPLSRLMPLSGQVGVRFDHPERLFWVEGVLVLAADADQLNTADRADTSRIPPGGTPGYEVFSVRTGWNINRNATVTVAIENLTDENYRIHGSGINEPGRSLALGVKIKF